MKILWYCNFTLQLYWNRTLAWVFSYKFAAYSQNTFSYEHLWTAPSVRVFIFFYLETTARKYNLHQNDFRHWYGNFSKLLSWKLLYRSYVRSFLSTITRHIGNSILKDTLQFNSFIKNWEDIWQENRRSCLKSYKLHKNASLHFQQHCTKIDHISLIFIRFFFSQANLVFKFILVLIGVLDNFYLFVFLLLFITLIILNFIQCLYTFLNKNHKYFDEAQCSFAFWRLTTSNIVIMFLFFS